MSADSRAVVAAADEGPRAACGRQGRPHVAACCLGTLVLLVSVAVVGATPVGGRDDVAEDSSDGDFAVAVDFLTRFGYLPPTEPNAPGRSLRSAALLRSAVRRMQRFGRLPLTGLVDGPTLQLMRQPRCGVPDVGGATGWGGASGRFRRFAAQGQRWNSTEITWSVRGVTSSTVRENLRRAFQVWSDASPLRFRESPGGGTARTDIAVSFPRGQHGDGYPFDGEGAVLAHAFFPGEGIGGDAHFDAEERWTEEQEGVSLFAVAAHEIGHSLGLSHSAAPGALMFPYYQALAEDFQLPPDDAQGIAHLYGEKESKILQPTTQFVAVTTTQPTTTAEVTNSSTETTLPKTELSHSGQEGTTETSYPSPAVPQVPDVCNTSIDAISVIRREVFVFKDKYFWRLDMNRTMRSGYPVPIDRFWYSLPHSIHRIDALYERPTDTKIVFFAGPQYWLFLANQPEPGYPRPLTDLGLPSNVNRIDAAMVWGYNGRTYFFSGAQYWKFDEVEGQVELDYPRDIGAWRGIPYGIDAAFTWNDGNTYFFKGNDFWKFHDVKMKIESKTPSDIGEFWFKCGIKRKTKIPERNTTESIIDIADTNASNMLLHTWLSIASSLFFYTYFNIMISS